MCQQQDDCQTRVAVFLCNCGCNQKRLFLLRLLLGQSFVGLAREDKVLQAGHNAAFLQPCGPSMQVIADPPVVLRRAKDVVLAKGRC